MRPSYVDKLVRAALTYVAAITLITTFWLVPARPAVAAFGAATAVGVGATADARVWEAVATTQGSLVRARAYKAGLPGAGIDVQRWQWERVASSTTAGITFRIRNVAAQRCLDRTTAGVVVNTCSTAASQRWRAPLDDPYGGWTLVNTGNSQCLSTRDTAAGSLLQTAACNGGALQRWRMRTAPQDCTIRSRDWTITEVCALQAAERMQGVMANWHHRPLSMPWVDPQDYILTHTVKNFVQVRPLKADASQGQTGVEIGTRADRSVSQSGSVAYTGYWMEWNTTTERYNSLSATQAPGSTTADGRNHTFMMLGKGNAGQWDLLYDHNVVATTTLQAGGTTRVSRSGMAVRYPHAVTAAQAFGFRMQIMTGNQVWRLPYLSETGLGEPKKCETPPRYEDWVYDVVNLPPNCFTSSYKVLAAPVATDPAVLDSFGVGKPATLTAAAAPAAGKRAPMTGKDALEAAGRTFGASTGTATVDVRTTSATKALARGGDRPVHVVTSAARVGSLAVGNTNTYDGYVAVFDATDHTLLHACLGSDCAGQR